MRLTNRPGIRGRYPRISGINPGEIFRYHGGSYTYIKTEEGATDMMTGKKYKTSQFNKDAFYEVLLKAVK